MADLLKLNQVETDFGLPISLILPEGRLGMLLGEPGSGKGELLRVIAGIRPFVAGEVFLQGDLVVREGKVPPPWERDIELVLRDGGLYPHLTVIDNLLLALQGHKLSGKRQHCMAVLSDLQLAPLARYYPEELSVEERLMVTIARALVTRPALLLIEEPLLDLPVEARLPFIQRMPRLMALFNCGCLLSSSVREGVLYSADYAGVMDEGRLLQWDTPQTLYQMPKDRLVARYMGEGVLVKGVVHDELRLDTELGMVDHPTGFGLPAGTRLELLIRPEDIVFDEKSRRRARVLERSVEGGKSIYHLQLTVDHEIRRLFSTHLDSRISGELRYRLEIRSMVLFRRRGTQ